jgi:hypothetical protein
MFLSPGRASGRNRCTPCAVTLSAILVYAATLMEVHEKPFAIYFYLSGNASIVNPVSLVLLLTISDWTALRQVAGISSPV